MADKFTGDVPYYRTVPSSPSEDGKEQEEEELEEPQLELVEMSPIYQQKTATTSATANEQAEEDEETMLRRRLLEKKLEKEKEQRSTAKKQDEKSSSGSSGTTKATSASSSAEPKEKTKREKIVWSKGEREGSSKGGADSTSSSRHIAHSSSRERETQSRHHGDSRTTVRAKDDIRDKDKPSSSSTSSSSSKLAQQHKSAEGRDRPKVPSSSSSTSAEHRHHHGGGGHGADRHHRQRAEEDAAKKRAKRKEEEEEAAAAGRKKRPREVSNSSSEEGRKRKNNGKRDEEPEAVKELGQQQEQQPMDVGELNEEGELEAEAIQHGQEVEAVHREEKKPKKYSKFESSPEPSSSDDEHEDVKQQPQRPRADDAQADAVIHRQPLPPRKYTLSEDLDDDFGMDDDAFRHRLDTVDTDMNGTEHGGDDLLDDDLAEHKDFDQLTEEEKAVISPETLKRKEEQYQRRLVAQLPVYYPGISGCRGVAEYECLNKISEGTFGVVYRAQNKRTDEIVALKRLKMEKEHQGFPITSLREINMLLKCGTHPNVVNVREVVVGSSMDRIYLVMDYVEHDVKALMELMKSRNKKWTIPQVKTLMRQLLSGVYHLHDEYVIHRDLKTSNLLLSHQGILKIGDFGLAREFGEPLKAYTPVVVTLWYRSPELLLGTKITDAGPASDPGFELLYSTPVDMWSVGCIFAEFLKLEPLFPGRSELDQMQKIFKEVGTPNEQIWPGCTQMPGMKTGVFADTPYNQLRKKFAAELPDDDGYELLNKLLALNPQKRIDAKQALTSKWFVNEPKPADPSTFPTWPAKSEQNRRPPNEPLAPRGGPPKPAGGFTLKFDVPKFG